MHRGHFGQATVELLVRTRLHHPGGGWIQVSLGITVQSCTVLCRLHAESRPWLLHLSAQFLHRQHTNCSFWDLQRTHSFTVCNSSASPTETWHGRYIERTDRLLLPSLCIRLLKHWRDRRASGGLACGFLSAVRGVSISSAVLSLCGRAFSSGSVRA